MKRALVALTLLAASATLAAEDWTLTTADFQTRRVALTSVSEKGVQIVEANAAKTIPLDQFLDLDRALGAPPAAPLVLYLTGGDRLTGSAIGIQDEQLQWKQPILGELKIPLRKIIAIAKPGQVPPREDEARTEDVATLSNGDSVRGILGSLTADAVTINSNGQDVSVPFATVNSISFASTSAAGQGAVARGFRVTLADGSAFTGSKIDLQKTDLRITPENGDARSIPLGSVARIEQINGPVAWLVSRIPSENVQIPYFAAQPQPAKMGLSVDGQPVRIGDKTFPHAIGAHAYSRLVFPIDPAYKSFRTQYAIDGNLSYANVTLRIKLDDKVAFEQKDVTAGPIAKPIVLDVNGAKLLTLEVDYGKTYDVQDRLNWVEPALLKSAPPPVIATPTPATAPATVPATTQH